MFYLLFHLSSDTWIVSTFDDTTINVGIQLSVPGPICRSGIAGSHDNSVLRFLRKKQFLIVVEPFYTFTFLSVTYKVCNFSTLCHQNFSFFFLFKNYHSHSSECEVVSPLHIFLWEMYNQIFCPFLNWVPCVYWVIGVFIYSGFYGFSYYIKKKSLPF